MTPQVLLLLTKSGGGPEPPQTPLFLPPCIAHIAVCDMGLLVSMHTHTQLTISMYNHYMDMRDGEMVYQQAIVVYHQFLFCIGERGKESMF